jgi:hypothetical protein
MRQVAIGLFLLSVGTSVAYGQSSESSSEKRAASPTKWDKRVLDTFFPDAREALVGPRPAVLMSAGRVQAQNRGKPGATGDPQSAGPDATYGWSKLISADTLQDEVKALAPLLADDVKTQQAFLGGSNKKSRRTLSLLAALFAVISEYDGDVKWKDQAPTARDLFAKAGFNSKAATESTFRDAKMRSDDLATILRGETLKAPENQDPKNQWGKVANLAPLMSRLDTAQQNRIAPATSTASEFKKNAAQLTHEAEIVAALAEVIARPGMDNAEDEKFRGYAKTLEQSALDLRSAVSSGNYEQGRTAAGVMTKSCANCHAEFR